MSRIVRGRVRDFEREVGLGAVSGDDGAVYPFHCIEIADGSRDIEPGTEVAFVVLDRLGHRQAGRLTSW